MLDGGLGRGMSRNVLGLMNIAVRAMGRPGAFKLAYVAERPEILLQIADPDVQPLFRRQIRGLLIQPVNGRNLFL